PGLSRPLRLARHAQCLLLVKADGAIMALNQSIDRALEKNIGRHGVAEDKLAATLAATQGALEWLRDQHATGKLPLLRVPERQDDLAGIGEAAAGLREGATDVVMLGTG